MYSQAILLFAVLSATKVCSSYYHGPTAKPIVLHNGYLADTHEVAEAKNAHLATLAKYTHTNGENSEHADESHEELKYHGPTYIPHVLHNGFIADTHEVAAAKDEHLAAVNKAKSHTHKGEYEDAYNGHYSGDHNDHSEHGVHYHGPTAKPVVLKTGFLADTHDVSAAKGEHLAAVNKAKSHTREGHEGEYEDAYNRHYAGDYHDHSEHGVHYHGPTAKPVVLKSGFLADTYEVSAAKELHLQALHSSKQNSYDHSY